ncbi:MAG TPA: 2-oxoacid:acceptor oxidoreductase subunit alpha [Thermovirgaceae bacterium]|nr:2-oxoacid:acceptor oxidoreductase subunit alpha [Thermovirgaceae bacterium]
MPQFPHEGFSDLSIVLCGAAGQGVQTVEEILVDSLRRSGLNLFASREYMSRVRGGSNSTELRVSSERVNALVDRIDILLPLNGGIRPNIRKRISPGTLILGDIEELKDEFGDSPGIFMNVPLMEKGRESGGAVYTGVVAVGLLSGLLDLPTGIIRSIIEEKFSGKSAEIVRNNLSALEKGLEIASELRSSGDIVVEIPNPSAGAKEMVLNGSDAVSLGAIAGGCDFIASYPMSPATGVLTFMARHARKFGVAVEQAEDEIAAINMATGASYGGARSMVSTSGGGLSLMSEGVSLAGITEIPVVLHIGQRPGPATGMATRTEQGDLNLAVFCGHGDIPRIVFAPGTLEQAFRYTREAFNLAAEFQIPVFVLTDQYFLNSFYNIPPFDLQDFRVERHLVEAVPGYRRYENTPDGVSPRSVPGFGMELVGTDSHEHDAWGHAQEDFELRKSMVEKRLRKMKGILGKAEKPTLEGPEDFRDLVVSWGSTCHIVREALEKTNSGKVAHLHFGQVFPLHRDTVDILASAERVVAVEGNATGQFAGLIRKETGFLIEEKVLWYSGLQMSVETVAQGLKERLGQGG